ncbi:hypothetical protein ACN20G_20300 [Streptomyces sp. BI20]|uniref:hypothetical protein n=1 Tax=Streptomyces sp. BI20 TaxID=3403460 RepID=UPI003C758CB3
MTSPSPLVLGADGIRYADGTPRTAQLDRWYPVLRERPDPATVHDHHRPDPALLWDRADRRLCSSCGGPPDRSDAGVLWLLPGSPPSRAAWPGWVDTTHPPLCAAHAHAAVTACPSLGAAHFPLRARHVEPVGVLGVRHDPVTGRPEPGDDGDADGLAFVPFTDPATLRLTAARSLVLRLSAPALSALPTPEPSR